MAETPVDFSQPCSSLNGYYSIQGQPQSFVQINDDDGIVCSSPGSPTYRTSRDDAIKQLLLWASLGLPITDPKEPQQ